MKHLFETILSIVVCGFISETTAQTYQVTISNEPFVFLEKAQPAVVGAWETPEFQLPLGFDFEFFDITTNQLYSIFNSFGIDLELNQETGHLYQLFPFFGSMIDRGYQQDSALSPITFQTEGLPGGRIFTIEYKEAGFYDGIEDENGVFQDYISIQIRLYETSGDIEFHIGPYFIQEDTKTIFQGKPGPIIGLIADGDYVPDDLFGELILLEGDPLKPIINTDTTAFLEWPIPENTVYRFSKMGTSVGDQLTAAKHALFFPNPTSGDIYLNKSISNNIIYPIIVLDIHGKQVGLWSNEKEISGSKLSNGCYYIFCQFNDEVFTQKLIVLPK